ncbi:hypothetical protein [Alicyclobacillus sp.]|uniref:hypothetical protein n=1 Tax=Alicyclobacillus sp. TaxID=61169 RepID=UPI0025C6E113|nr:hypothetical protein [Alicyclobacillus sp.]MCL6515443.1 hypothetical protein [Alicyclobacillus sp.]
MSDLTHRVQRYLGRCVQCHTHYGTFYGVMVHCTPHHVILAPIPYFHLRGPTGPMGGGPPWGGGGWNLAIPLAAILGITAIGIHWW